MPVKRLILGPGKHWPKIQDHLYADHFCDVLPFDNVDSVHDLNKVPWPFPDRSFIHVSAIHLVEHLQQLVSFMNEAWRVLEPGGTLYIETPEAGGDYDLTHADPTHVRCYRIHSFINYFLPEGVQKFGYTDKAWTFVKTESRDGILFIAAIPIKS
jgi:hypothetical protein